MYEESYMKMPNLLKNTLEKVHVKNDVLGVADKSEQMQRYITHKKLKKRKRKIKRRTEQRQMVAKARERPRYRGC